MSSLSQIKTTSNKCQRDSLLKDSLLIIHHLRQRGNQWERPVEDVPRVLSALQNECHQ